MMGFGSTGSLAGTGAGALGLYNDIQRGGVTGDVGAAAQAAKLAGKYGSSAGLSSGTTGALNTGATGALDALGMYQGIKQGGVGGYGQALGSGLQGAGLLTSNPALSAIGGDILAPLAVYNAVKNWQSGKTGSDALQGAEAGAAVGSVVPVLGTALGAIVGGLVGAGSSAFGGGAHDPETDSLYKYLGAYNTPGGGSQLAAGLSPAQNYQNLAGIFDAKNNTAGHSTPLEQYYGRMGEGNFLNDITGQINQAIASGKVQKGASAQDLYSQVVNPYLQSKNIGIDPNASIYTTAKGQKFGNAMQDDITNLLGQWQKGQLTNQSKVGVSGQTDPGLQAYGALAQMAQPQNTTTQPVRPVMAGTPYLRAEGGSMSALDCLPGKKVRRKKFDDGSDSADFSNSFNQPDFSVVPAGSYDNPPPATNDNSWMNDPTIMGGGYPAPASGGSTPSWMSDPSIMGGNYSSQTGIPGAGTTGGSYSDLLSNLAKTLTGQGPKGAQGSISALQSLAPLIAAFANRAATTRAIAPPQAFPGMTQGASAPPTPGFNRTQVANPSNLPGGGPMSLQDWYTYGSRPEASFFQNNSIPLAKTTGISHKKGGALSQLGSEEQGEGMPEFDSTLQNHVEGPGDGTSDDIPASLSDGEYVMDAGSVSMLGNGSNKAGAQRLDELRQNLRKHAGKSLTRGKQFMKAKKPEQYIKGGKQK